MTQSEIAQVEKIVGYVFRDKNLLVQALTHVSYVNEHKNSVSYEKSRTEAELRQQYYQIALGYLINSGYLYGGVMLCSTARNW